MSLKASLRKARSSLYDTVLNRVFLKSDYIHVHSSAKKVAQQGYVIHPLDTYYCPIPDINELEKNKSRWYRPSAMQGVAYDLEDMKKRVSHLITTYNAEVSALPSVVEVSKQGWPGFSNLDAHFLYMIIRDLKPRRYMEVGSGMSTYYCKLAGEKNATEGKKLQIQCIEPYPEAALKKIGGIEINQKLVQDVPLEYFEQLEAGDVLFVDSSHTIKIDGDVPYLFLEVFPRLKKGVLIHVHDIPFPYNVPYPADRWLFNLDWPMYWTEAMLLQAFLAFNKDFQLRLALPMLRHHDPAFLDKAIPQYADPSIRSDTFSSVWIERVK